MPAETIVKAITIVYEALCGLSMPYPRLLKSGSLEPEKSQKEGQEDQGAWIYFCLVLLAFLLPLPWAPWNSIKGATFEEMRVKWT